MRERGKGRDLGEELGRLLTERLLGERRSDSAFSLKVGMRMPYIIDKRKGGRKVEGEGRGGEGTLRVSKAR